MVDKLRKLFELSEFTLWQSGIDKTKSKGLISRFGKFIADKISYRIDLNVFEDTFNFLKKYNFDIAKVPEKEKKKLEFIMKWSGKIVLKLDKYERIRKEYGSVVATAFLIGGAAIICLIALLIALKRTFRKKSIFQAIKTVFNEPGHQLLKLLLVATALLIGGTIYAIYKVLKMQDDAFKLAAELNEMLKDQSDTTKKAVMEVYKKIQQYHIV